MLCSKLFRTEKLRLMVSARSHLYAAISLIYTGIEWPALEGADGRCRAASRVKSRRNGSALHYNDAFQTGAVVPDNGNMGFDKFKIHLRRTQNSSRSKIGNDQLLLFNAKLHAFILHGDGTWPDEKRQYVSYPVVAFREMAGVASSCHVS